MANLVGVPLIYIFISLGSHPAHLQRLCDLKNHFEFEKFRFWNVPNQGQLRPEKAKKDQRLFSTNQKMLILHESSISLITDKQ